MVNDPVVLIAEDEIAQADVLKFNLEAEGFNCHVVHNGAKALSYLENDLPDVLLLDWMLPEMSGIQLCQKLREQDHTKRLPVIMLTARGEDIDRLRGFEVGADDYVVKPYLFSELVARIRAVLRRSRPELDDEYIQHKDIKMDLVRQKVTRDDKDINLSALEFRLLRSFLAKPGRVLSRDQLIDLAWGTGIHVLDRTVDVSVRRLRSALNEYGGEDVIRTVRGFGYALDE